MDANSRELDDHKAAAQWDRRTHLLLAAAASLCSSACAGADDDRNGFLSGGYTSGGPGDPTGGQDGGSGGPTDSGDGGSSDGGSGPGSTGGSGTDDGNPTDGTSSSTGSGDSGDGSDTAGDDGNVRFDVGGSDDIPGGGTGPGNGQGCAKIDFLFVVDNSGSMEDEQQNLVTSFPGFIQSIQSTVMAQDYQIMVIDSDADGGSGQGCPGSPGDASLCASWCSTCPSHCSCVCAGSPCPPPPSGDCDDELGAGKVESQTGNDCGIVGGNRYMSDGQPNLSTTFSCAALVGSGGDGNEKPMEAMVESVTSLDVPGACNEGFVRDDAILVVTFITDEEDNGKSTGNPTTWKNALVSVKNGDETAIVMLGLVGDPNVPGGRCAGTGNADDAPTLRTFASSFTHGMWASVCEPDYAPFFDQAVSVIDTACEEFEPPG